MITYNPNDLPLPRIQGYLQGVIGPRPIALASTIDKMGNVNLSPFSFFNLFSNRPAILVFSPSRRGRNNTTKDTYENLLEVPEVVINVVSYSMVEQVSLASVEFPKGVNEFVKTGLTPVPSVVVRPPRVGESPASFECIVKQVLPLGDEGGSGNLAICEVKLAHFKEELFDEQGRIDPQKVDLVARMGGDFYCRAKGENIFSVPKPNERPAVGYDSIPEAVRASSVLTGNDLGRLGNVESLPGRSDVEGIKITPEYKIAVQGGAVAIHNLAQQLLRADKTIEAWKVLLAFHVYHG